MNHTLPHPKVFTNTFVHWLESNPHHGPARDREMFVFAFHVACNNSDQSTAHRESGAAHQHHLHHLWSHCGGKKERNCFPTTTKHATTPPRAGLLPSCKRKVRWTEKKAVEEQGTPFYDYDAFHHATPNKKKTSAKRNAFPSPFCMPFDSRASAFTSR